MSASKLRRGRAGADQELDAGPYALPATVTRAPLLKGGSDQRFRVLVADLFTISMRMEMVREHLGRRMGISGPQYSIVVALPPFRAAMATSSAGLARRCTCRAHLSRPRPANSFGAGFYSNVST